MADDQIQPNDDSLEPEEHEIPEDEISEEGFADAETSEDDASDPVDDFPDDFPAEDGGDGGVFDWGDSDEATDFLGLNDAVGESRASATNEAAQPYAMPGSPPLDEAPRTNWLLNQAGPSGVGGANPTAPGYTPAADAVAGQAGAENWGGDPPQQNQDSWLMHGEEPAPLPGRDLRGRLRRRGDLRG